MRLEPADRRAHAGDNRRRIAARPDEQRRRRAHHALERKVEVGARLVGQRRAADVADDADDLRFHVAEADAMAERLLAGEMAVGGGLADDHDRRAGRVARLEQAAGCAAGICSARKYPRDASCQPTSGGRCPAASGRSTRCSGAVQLLPVSGVTIAAPTVSTSGSASIASNARRRTHAAPRRRRSGLPAATAAGSARRPA